MYNVHMYTLDDENHVMIAPALVFISTTALSANPEQLGAFSWTSLLILSCSHKRQQTQQWLIFPIGGPPPMWKGRGGHGRVEVAGKAVSW